MFKLLVRHKMSRTLTACLLLCAMLLSACGAPAPASAPAEESAPPEEPAGETDGLEGSYYNDYLRETLIALNRADAERIEVDAR